MVASILKKCFCVALLGLMPTFACADETLTYRRIVTCSVEKDYELCQQLINDFIKDYPNSSNLEKVYLLLADLNTQQKNYENAIAIYRKQKEYKSLNKNVLNKMECLCRLKLFDELDQELTSLQTQLQINLEDNPRLNFYAAETLFWGNIETKNCEAWAKAEQKYIDLLQTDLKFLAQMSLIHLYSEKNEPEKVAYYCAMTADAPLEIQENLQFIKACYQAKYNVELAINSFKKIYDAGNKFSKEALYNWLIFSHQHKKFEAIAQCDQELIEQLPSQYTCTAHELLAESYYKIKNYPQAIQHADSALEGTCDSNIALVAAQACFKLKDGEKLDHYISVLTNQKQTPHHTAWALCWRGKLFQDEKEYVRAFKYFQKAAEFNDDTVTLFANYEMAYTYFLQNQHQKACDLIQHCLTKYPCESFKKPALQLFVKSAESCLSKKDCKRNKQLLLSAYETALAQNDLFTEAQRATYLLNVAKLNFELKQYENFLSSLDLFLQEFPKNTQQVSAHLLYAAYYNTVKKDPQAYLNSLETLLALEPRDDVKLSTMHDLFYGYLSQMQKKKVLQPYLTRASEMALNLIQLKQELPKRPYLWLCQSMVQFLSEPKNHEHETLELSEKLLSHYIEAFSPLSTIEEKILSFHLAQHLGWSDQYLKQIYHLEQTLDLLPENHFAQLKSLYLLAKAHEKQNNPLKAVEIFSLLLDAEKKCPQNLLIATKLHLSRLLCQAPRSQNSVFLNKLYNSLFTLRSIHTEPLHFQAALNAALYHHQQELPEGIFGPYLDTLVKLKKSYVDTDTLPDKEYHELRTQMPQKNQLYQHYMIYLDAHIAHVKSKLDTEQSQTYKQQCSQLLDKLSYEPVDEYLKELCRWETKLLKQSSWASESLLVPFTIRYDYEP